MIKHLHMPNKNQCYAHGVEFFIKYSNIISNNLKFINTYNFQFKIAIRVSVIKKKFNLHLTFYLNDLVKSTAIVLNEFVLTTR